MHNSSSSLEEYSKSMYTGLKYIVLFSHIFSSHSFEIEYPSLDGQMSAGWPWMEIFLKLYQMFSVARLWAALGDSRLALHWYYFIWMRWMQSFSSKHLLKTLQSIVALMSRPKPSEFKCFVENIFIACFLIRLRIFVRLYDFHFAF